MAGSRGIPDNTIQQQFDESAHIVANGTWKTVGTQRNDRKGRFESDDAHVINAVLESEQKIDGIARDIDGIKHLLQTLQLSGEGAQPKTPSTIQRMQDKPTPLPEDAQQLPQVDSEIAWGHSAHLIDFIRAVVRDGASRPTGLEASETLLSLQSLLHTLEAPPKPVKVASLRDSTIPPQTETNMPPQDSVVTVLRWAKEHASSARITWLAQLLPLERFADICQNVYFSIHDYSEIEFVLANGYLSYVFLEHVVISGQSDYSEHSRLCRNNFNAALSRIPLLLPSSMEVVVVLTLGAYNAIEDSKANAAWTFISAAANHCLTLGYNLHKSYREKNIISTAARERLFWAVYKLDKGISLRLGRSSTIRDGDISLPFSDDSRMRTARIQGRTYDELYSPKGLMREDAERAYIAESLAAELHKCITETRAATSGTVDNFTDKITDPVGDVYIRCELICQYSVLALVLRAIPASTEFLCSISDRCIAVAHEALRTHEECIIAVRNCNNESLMLTRYVNWSIVHCPFPPFSILLTNAVQRMDTSELDYLEQFAASLKPPDASMKTDTTTQPHQLYDILCKAARLYLDFNTVPVDEGMLGFQWNTLTNVDPAGHGRHSTLSELPELRHEEGWLGEWFYGNQLVMSVLDENTFF